MDPTSHSFTVQAPLTQFSPVAHWASSQETVEERLEVDFERYGIRITYSISAGTAIVRVVLGVHARVTAQRWCRRGACYRHRLA